MYGSFFFLYALVFLYVCVFICINKSSVMFGSSKVFCYRMSFISAMAYLFSYTSMY